MNDLELRAGTSFVDVVKNFLGNRRAKNYEDLVKKAVEKSTGYKR